MRYCLILLALCVGCDSTEVEHSGVLKEPAIVLDTFYTPSRHEAGTKTSSEYKFDWWSGDYRRVPVSKPTIITVPATYGVIFECEHGKFVIDSAANGERLWKKLKKGQRVIIHYREMYRVRYKEGREIWRDLCDYDFLDAVPADTDLEEAR